jgi:hypothetical protein
VDEVSIRKKNDGNFTSCATRNDAVSRHFFSDGYFNPQTKKINSMKKKDWITSNTFIYTLALSPEGSSVVNK